MTESTPLERVLERVAPGARIVETKTLQGGISAEMIAIEFERPDSTRQTVIVRRPGAAALNYNPLTTRHEFRRLQLVRTLGLPSQTPLLLDESGEIFTTPYLVMEYITGESVYNPPDVSSFLAQCAAHLAAIHSADISAADLSVLGRQGEIFPETPRLLPPVLDGSFDVEHIRRVLLEQQPIVRKNRDALLHGDFWPGNLLWRDNRLVAVIDWEDAQVGDPLYDFAISRMDIHSLLGSAAMAEFSDRYRAAMALDYSQLPYWDLNAALRILRISGADLTAWADYFSPILDMEITAEMIRTRYNEFITQALAELDAQA